MNWQTGFDYERQEPTVGVEPVGSQLRLGSFLRVVAITATATPEDDWSIGTTVEVVPSPLDAAWAEAEVWHPNLWPTHLMDGTVAYWTATVTREGPFYSWAFEGPTPVSALRALTANCEARDE
jgi:hypothetical protein